MLEHVGSDKIIFDPVFSSAWCGNVVILGKVL